MSAELRAQVARVTSDVAWARARHSTVTVSRTDDLEALVEALNEATAGDLIEPPDPDAIEWDDPPMMGV